MWAPWRNAERISVGKEKGKERRKEKKTSGKRYRNLLKSLSKMWGNDLIIVKALWLGT